MVVTTVCLYYKIYKGWDLNGGKRWKCGNLRLACIGVENQTSSDPDMPLRVIAYDGMEYRAQLLGKESVRDNRYPVITIVLYFGHRTPWTDSISLKDRLNIPDGFDCKLSNNLQ